MFTPKLVLRRELEAEIIRNKDLLRRLEATATGIGGILDRQVKIDVEYALHALEGGKRGDIKRALKRLEQNKLRGDV